MKNQKMFEMNNQIYTYIYIYIESCMELQNRSPSDMLSKSQALTCCLNQWIGFEGKKQREPPQGKHIHWKRPWISA